MDPSELSSNELALRCAESTRPELWREFVQRFHRPISLSVLRVARTTGRAEPSRVAEVVQDVFVKLCADERHLLLKFRDQGPDSIVGYLKVVASNVAHDVFRADRRQKRGGGAFAPTKDPDAVGAAADLRGQELGIMRAVQIREVDDALSGFVPSHLTERDRTIYQLYFKQGLTAKDIGSIAALGLSVKGVESSIHRITTLLRGRFQQREL